MTRSYGRREIPPAPQPQYESFTAYMCDGCGKTITRSWPECEEHDNYAHELVIAMDQDECVNFFRQRDYCPTCMDPVWQAINKLITADPEAERDREYE